jgi:hypothetical protein
MNRHFTFYILHFTLFITICACSKFKKEETKTEKPIFANEEVIPVQLAKVDTVSRAEPIFASGMVASTDEARMSFKVGGIIQKICSRRAKSEQRSAFGYPQHDRNQRPSAAGAIWRRKI